MSNNVTLRQLRAFCAVADAGSFTEAAKRLHLSQAALSGLIKELESQMDVRLINRSTRMVSLTTVGEAFSPLAERVLDDLDDALANIKNLTEMRRGIVRFATPEVLSCTLIPELILAYGETYPDIEVRFTDVPIEDVFTRLANGEIDVGIAPYSDNDSRFDSEVLMESRFWAALRPDDPLAAKSRVSWKDIQDRTFITFLRNFTERVLRRVPADAHPHEIHHVRRINTALSMLRAQGGVTVCPAFARSLVQGFGLVFRPLEGPEIYRKTAIFTRAGIALSPAAESFVQFTQNFAGGWLEMVEAEDAGEAHGTKSH
ncbi:LysR family transcriptional regulator [Halomonas ramblicola]|uniref:LysR family transcriptional regulator n=1 Tax=Halomonas ramblicola TaxID=747349 RepID=UPI0025B5C6A4|nr:LysR family transcriptional regulator [Halomonas ramblicola]MDN3522009.1 LysR substrate-binding domain-containing protein [Halomonas ramblicola]